MRFNIISHFPPALFLMRWKLYVSYLFTRLDLKFGFRANHSTAHALLLITDQIQRAIEGGHFTCGIFLDLSQAFDTVDHNTLLAKLYSYVIRGIAYDCFLSYLSNCCPFVSIGNTSSTSNPFTSGVPQGSVLGPLYIYIYKWFQ